jgi:hypothetical protein
MFVLRSKVKIEDVSAKYTRMGVAGAEASETIARRFGKKLDSLALVDAQDGSIAIALGAARFLVVSPVEMAHAMWGDDRCRRHPPPVPTRGTGPRFAQAFLRSWRRRRKPSFPRWRISISSAR